MPLLRFLTLLFVFVGLLASSLLAVSLLVLMLRFWPLALAIVLALALFSGLLRRSGTTFSTPSTTA
ncbi:hypothetical protein NS274_06700 [Pseudomonas oryzihabitans]|uniref:hypothetical protein n=1 Tax=Pseudomonas rhizoryzae TaxID=2571129 RepID=UPI000736FF3B|nr:hypothetical protein [Pseudomonas rhizoryzae]KTS78395.1 hypothetical protein NS274_06700 [Pseudomonas psychrotolerans]KTT29943.1 hypothetical protein NS201_14905 [Pseudomonas psychrotolerans]KTT35311.1 hypothetical protein SB9_09590 [Pseudomonas psychrotolerans]KTT45534.1 hypothetical protein RSA46_07220 [Pseudomonas psychrotolerans]KTT48464.1 hypothetical protein SB11R_16340 [Pseudomonas psychrotolerans]